MADLCQKCPIRVNCDWLSEMCLLSPSEVARTPKLLRGRSEAQQAATRKMVAAAAERAGHFRLGFKKYDKRRKPDNPLRRKWRRQKERQNFWKKADRKRAEVRG